MRRALLTAFALLLAIARAAEFRSRAGTLETIKEDDEVEEDVEAGPSSAGKFVSFSHARSLALDSNKEHDSGDGFRIEYGSDLSEEFGGDSDADFVDEESSVVDPDEFVQKQLERETISASKCEYLEESYDDPDCLTLFDLDFDDAETSTGTGTGEGLHSSSHSACSTSGFEEEVRRRSRSVFANPQPNNAKLPVEEISFGEVCRSRPCTPNGSESDAISLPPSSALNMEWVETVLVDRLLGSNCIFEKVDAEWILREMTRILRYEGTIHDIDLEPDQRLVLVGDIHGQLDDLVSILRKYGYPSSTTIYLFNGDLVDRGPRSMECILLVFLLKCIRPFSVYITRGNHESYTVATDTFYHECLEKYDCTDAFWHECHDVFAWLSLGFVVQGKIFVCHGGLQPGMCVEQMREIQRESLLADFKNCPEAFAMLWHDPQDAEGMGMSSKRGNMPAFGPDVTRDFLDRHNFRVLVRGHEMKRRGFSFTHSNRCLTIFSASDYCGLGNQGAVLIVDYDRCRVERFRAKKAAVGFSIEETDGTLENLDENSS